MPRTRSSTQEAKANTPALGDRNTSRKGELEEKSSKTEGEDSDLVRGSTKKNVLARLPEPTLHLPRRSAGCF